MSRTVPLPFQIRHIEVLVERFHQLDHALDAFRLAVHLQRMGTLFKRFGVIAPDSPWPVNNIGTQALAPLIGIDHPPPEPMPALPS